MVKIHVVVVVLVGTDTTVYVGIDIKRQTCKTFESLNNRMFSFKSVLIRIFSPPLKDPKVWEKIIPFWKTKQNKPSLTSVFLHSMQRHPC